LFFITKSALRNAFATTLPRQRNKASEGHTRKKGRKTLVSIVTGGDGHPRGVVRELDEPVPAPLVGAPVASDIRLALAEIKVVPPVGRGRIGGDVVAVVVHGRDQSPLVGFPDRQQIGIETVVVVLGTRAGHDLDGSAIGHVPVHGLAIADKEDVLTTQGQVETELREAHLVAEHLHVVLPDVGVGVGVRIGIGVGVGIAVGVGVRIGIGVGVGIAVAVRIRVGVRVGVRVRVGVALGGVTGVLGDAVEVGGAETTTEQNRESDEQVGTHGNSFGR